MRSQAVAAVAAAAACEDVGEKPVFHKVQLRFSENANLTNFYSLFLLHSRPATTTKPLAWHIAMLFLSAIALGR